MDDGEGLFIIAALVIAFINWLSNTLKRKAAEREIERRRARGELVDEPAGWAAEPDEESWPSPDQPVVRESQDPNAEIRAFFDALSGNAPAAAPPPVVETVHAPVPAVVTAPAEVDLWMAPEIRRPTLSAGEQAALARIGHTKAYAQNETLRRHPIIEKLVRPGGAREAIVFAEILGKPKALAEG